VLKSDSLKLMFTPQKTKSGAETPYGIGWFVSKSASGKLIYEHSGGSVGGTSQLIVYPGTRVVIAMTNNLSNGPWKRQEVEAIAEQFETREK
jgi:serine beta-lactamase-like protein LACTB